MALTEQRNFLHSLASLLGLPHNPPSGPSSPSACLAAVQQLLAAQASSAAAQPPAHSPPAPRALPSLAPIPEGAAEGQDSSTAEGMLLVQQAEEVVGPGGLQAVQRLLQLFNAHSMVQVRELRLSRWCGSLSLG